MTKCSPKNGYQKDLCLEKIGLCACNVIIILNSVVKIIEGWGDLYDHFMSMIFFTLIMNIFV